MSDQEVNNEEMEAEEQGGEVQSSEQDVDDSEFDDPEGYEDNISNEELLADLMKERPVEETGYDNIIVVDNAPKVGPDRMAKLQSILTKVFGRFGKIVSQDYPIDENGIFKGYFFLEFSKPEEATNAVKTGNGYTLDKTHIFKVNFFSDFEKYANISEQWEPPKITEFKEIDNLRSWLLDDNCYDQCAVMYNQGLQVAIAQCTPHELKIVTERERWTEAYLRWSPQGSYLATLHKPGVAFWGTSSFSRFGKFEHHGVQLIDFSPCERYLVTLSNVLEDPQESHNIFVWDVKTGTRTRTFRSRGSADDWPLLKWSHDTKYVARMSENLLSVYEVPSFTLIDKKSIIAKGIRDFSWSPTDNLVAYWVPGRDPIPAKIIIIELPSRKEVCTKSRQDVKECRLHWHKQGNYLCVRVDHYITKKQEGCSFEIFHMREADIPVDTIEIKEQVQAFSLEPHGSKFCVIHGEPPTRISVSFYAIKDKGNKMVKISTLERRTSNTIFWSPAGQFVVLAGLKGMDGQLEFYDTADMTLMNAVEHSSTLDLEWDPTGRYLVSTVSVWNQKTDTGFYVWSFQGKPLYRNPTNLEKFCQFLWRPRPLSLLGEHDLKAIRKDYKKYHHTFEQKDKTIKSKASKELVEKRRKAMDMFSEYRRRMEQFVKQKLKTLGLAMPEEEEEYEEEEEVLPISEEYEFIQSKTA